MKFNKCFGDLELLLFVFKMDGCDLNVLVIYPLFSLVGYYLYSMAHVGNISKNRITFIFVWAITNIQQRMLSGCFEGYI